MKKHKGMQLTLRWVPGYKGVAGNEEADQVAKLAIEEESSLRGELPALLCKGLPQCGVAA
jgi:ribonuclease HI